MFSDQVAFYNSLTIEEKDIINRASLIVNNITSSNFAQKSPKAKGLPEKKVAELFTMAETHGLLIRSSYSRYYTTSIELLIITIPNCDESNINFKAKEFLFYAQSLIPYYLIRNMLANLFFDIKEYKTSEMVFLNNCGYNFHQILKEILHFEPYSDHLCHLEFHFLETLVMHDNAILIDTMLPINEQISRIKALTEKLFEVHSTVLPTLESDACRLNGNFEQSLATIADSKTLFYDFTQAIKFLYQNQTEESFTWFEKGLKKQKTQYKEFRAPLIKDAQLALAIVLTRIDPKIAMVFYRRIIATTPKIQIAESVNIFLILAYNAVNDVVNRGHRLLAIQQSIEYKSDNYSNLLNIVYLFLIGEKLNKSHLDYCLKVVQTAFDNGYLIPAHEAAYVLNKWFATEKTTQLFDAIAAKSNYEPALSQSEIKEDWEKMLNSLLAFKEGSTLSNSSASDSKYRLVYYLNMQHLYIQPMLQTRNKKGTWTEGRKIALRSLAEQTTEGMTDQDIRIAGKIKKYAKNYYHEDYCFSEDAIKEFVGHPYLFLEDSDNVSVELVAAQPILKIESAKKGYTISTDIVSHGKKIVVVKETNTRYKIYDLSATQQQIIRTFALQKMVIPAIGKEKLMQAIGGISSHFSVHSDIEESENIQIKKVDADARLRVQLLPMGNSLKAEIFAKPFGMMPPYCKPGKGGKTLITTAMGEQLQVSRDLDLERNYFETLNNEIQVLSNVDFSDDLIAFENPLDSLQILDVLNKHSDICVVEWPEGERFKIVGNANFGNLNLKIKSKNNWFELEGELRVNENLVLTIQQLLTLTTKSKNRFIELENGAFLSLSEKLRRRLEELHLYATQKKDSLIINKFASVASNDFFDEVNQLKGDKTWKSFRAKFDATKQTEIPIPSTLLAELRPYQEEGFRWLARLAEWESGACLADDMGLGKTIQTLAVLLHRAHLGPAMVVCPVSVVHNWINECAKFAPSLNVVTVHTGNREQILQNLGANDLLITSYGLLQSEEKRFTQIEFSTVVLDEAHTIKNFATKTSKVAMQLQASFRIALTGTPVQNHLGEVWNLFNFINPGLLGTLPHFTDTFIKSDEDYKHRSLKKLITPFLLRRTKSSVLDELPAKTEIVKKVSLSDEEMAYYEALRRQAIAMLESDDSSNQGTKHLKALAEITRLRQVCCNVALVNPELKLPSTKLNVLLEIVAELIDNRHKALIFSQFVTHLTLIRKALDKLGITYQYLDGSCTQADRQQSVSDFQNGKGDLFLISLKAGGLGLNLTAADYVIHMDPWWNPAIEDQASDRAHRYGQTRPVTIYRIVAENTIEEKIIQLHNTKRHIAESLLEGSDQAAKLSITELISLIKEGV